MPDFSIGFAQFTTLEEEKRTEKSPDVTGSIEIAEEDVAALINHLQTAEREDNWKEEKVVKLRLAGWNRMSRAGKPFLSGKLSEPYKPAVSPAVVVTASDDLDF